MVVGAYVLASARTATAVPVGPQLYTGQHDFGDNPDGHYK